MDLIHQIIESFPSSYITSLVMNGAMMFALFFAFYIFRKRIKTWRIIKDKEVSTSQYIREIKNFFISLVAISITNGALIYLKQLGYSKVYTNLYDYPLWWALASACIMLLADDAWFYWIHRLLHLPLFYKYIHREHHKSIVTNPFTSMSFHFLEIFLVTLWVIPVSFFIPVYPPISVAVGIYGFLDNIKLHLGYEIFPRGFNKTWLRFITSSTHHSMHHTKFSGNYASHFRFWDKLMGTEFSDYEAEFDKIQQQKKASNN